MLSVHEHMDALDLDLGVFWLDCTFLLVLAGKAAYICCQE